MTENDNNTIYVEGYDVYVEIRNTAEITGDREEIQKLLDLITTVDSKGRNIMDIPKLFPNLKVNNIIPMTYKVEFTVDAIPNGISIYAETNIFPVLEKLASMFTSLHFHATEDFEAYEVSESNEYTYRDGKFQQDPKYEADDWDDPRKMHELEIAKSMGIHNYFD